MTAGPCTAPVHTTPHSALEAARGLGDLIAAHAEQGEDARAVPAAVVSALADAGLLHLLVPRELGGSGLEIDAFCAVAEEVSRADASTGWSLVANALVTGLFAAHLDEGAAASLFADDGRAVAAGMLNPRGVVTDAGDGALAVGGRYSFASGSAHARWIGAAGLWDDGGDWTARAYLLPRSAVEMESTWEVVGLRATGSVDYTVPPQDVPAGWSFDLTTDRPLRGQASLRLGTVGLGVACHTAVALGTARRALEEIVRVVDAGKVRPPMPPVREQPQFLAGFAVIEGRYRAVRARSREVLREAVAAASRPGPVPDVVGQRLRQVATTTVDACLDVVTRCFAWSGSAGLRDPHPLQRCLRDMHAQKQHVLVDATSLPGTAEALMDRLRAA